MRPLIVTAAEASYCVADSCGAIIPHLAACVIGFAPQGAVCMACSSGTVEVQRVRLRERDERVARQSERERASDIRHCATEDRRRGRRS
jgi:hypothetical protein